MDPFDFYLAEKLGKTLAEIGEMSQAEYVKWRAWTVYRHAQQDLAQKEADRRASK